MEQVNNDLLTLFLAHGKLEQIFLLYKVLIYLLDMKDNNLCVVTFYVIVLFGVTEKKFISLM